MTAKVQPLHYSTQTDNFEKYEDLSKCTGCHRKKYSHLVGSCDVDIPVVPKEVLPFHKSLKFHDETYQINVFFISFINDPIISKDDKYFPLAKG